MSLPERSSRYLSYLPPAVAMMLAIPVLGFTYLWDDYNFLTNAVFYQLHDWFPAADDLFYRPISRGIYFTTLDLAGRYGPTLGHLLNLSFLVGIVFLLGSFTARIAGKRAGILAGLLFAGLGAAPNLVGWICLDQDLLAILFVVLALNLRSRGRDVAALAATAAALLSKETTLAVIPVLILFDWILDRKPYRIWKTAAAYIALIAVWGAIHPAVRILVARGLRSGATGYVGLGHTKTLLSHLGRYVLTVLNLPPYDPLPGWPVFGLAALLAALAIVATVLRHFAGEQDHESGVIPHKRVLLLGMLLAAGPLSLTTAMIEGWSPYYAAFPAIGVAIVGGVLLANRSVRTQAVVLVLYFTLGIWTRGPLKELTETSEPNFRLVSDALREVESGFRRLYPTFPHGTQVLLSVQAHGPGSIYMHMYVFQVLRIWYRDRSLFAVRPEERKPDAHPQLLTVVAPDRDVIDINLTTLFARSASGREPDYHVCEGAIRAYAMGLAGSGDTDAAVNLLLHLPEVNAGLQSVHRRMAAMFLYADQRDREAQAVLDSTVALPRGLALADLQAVLAEQPIGRVLDDHGLRAFTISAQDTAAVRELMRWFVSMGYVKPAMRFAHRLDKLSQGDLEAGAVARKMSAILEIRKRLPPGAAEVR